MNQLQKVGGMVLLAWLTILTPSPGLARCKDADISRLLWYVASPHITDTASDKQIVDATWNSIKTIKDQARSGDLTGIQDERLTAWSQNSGGAEWLWGSLNRSERRMRSVLRRILADNPQRPISERAFLASARKFLSADCSGCGL